MRQKIKTKVYRLGKLIGVFDTLTDAARSIGINPGVISRALKESIHIAAGYRFEKVDKNDRKRIKK